MAPMAPLILHEQNTPWRVFISWNDGRSWWEVVPEQFYAGTTSPPRVTRERFRRPTAYWNQRRHD